MTDEEVNYRIKVIYLTSFTYLTITLPLVPVTTQAIVPFSVPSIEISVTRSSFTAQEKLLLDLRRCKGENSLPEFIIKAMLFTWRLLFLYNAKLTPTEGFQIMPPLHQHYDRQKYSQVAPKLEENPVDINNRGQGGQNCKINQNPSMDAVSH